MARPLSTGITMLRAVHRLGPTATNRALANEMQTTHSSAKTMVRTLVLRGLLEQEGQFSRRRLHVTDAGWAFIADEEPRVARIERQKAAKPKHKSATVSKPRPKNYGPPKRRRCLGPDCGKTFRSTWAGDRLCGSCKSSKAWRDNAIDDFPVRL